MGWMADGGEHLRRAYIRATEHAHLAIGVRQSGRPLDGVVTVFALMLEGVPLALGGKSPTHILRHNHIAACDGLAGKDGDRVLAIRRPLQEHGKGAFPGRTVDVRAQRHSVARLHRNIALDNNIGSSLSLDWNARQQRYNESKQAKRLFQH